MRINHPPQSNEGMLYVGIIVTRMYTVQLTSYPQLRDRTKSSTEDEPAGSMDIPTMQRISFHALYIEDRSRAKKLRT